MINEAIFVFRIYSGSICFDSIFLVFRFFFSIFLLWGAANVAMKVAPSSGGVWNGADSTERNTRGEIVKGHVIEKWVI